MKLLGTLSTCFLVAAGLFCGASAHASELLLDGTFATTVALPAANYSATVGRSGDTAATYFLTGTTTAGLGWMTDGPNGVFEIWTAGFMNTPAGIGNVLELADNTVGNNISQTVNSTVNGGTVGNVSFGYAARDSGKDQFTVSLTNVTTGGTVFSQTLDPTNGLANPITFSQAFTIIPGDAYKLNYLDQSTNGGPLSAHIDTVSLTQVPEPSSAFCMLVGALGLGTVGWKRRSLVRGAR